MFLILAKSESLPLVARDFMFAVVSAINDNKFLSMRFHHLVKNNLRSSSERNYYSLKD
jgi:hypothetical protein